MSRTDVHAPARVKDRDPAWRSHFTPEHRHVIQECWDPELCRYLVRRTVMCDLDRFLAGEEKTHCQMRYTGPNNIMCGCRMCTGQADRKHGRRRERAEWRVIRQDVLKTTAADRDDIVVLHPIAGRTW